MGPTCRILSEKGTKSETDMAAEQTGGQHECFECAVRLMLNVELT